MRTCERLVKEGRFTPSNPVGILTSGYYELLQNKVPLLGECTQTTPRCVYTHTNTHSRGGSSDASHVTSHTLRNAQQSWCMGQAMGWWGLPATYYMRLHKSNT